MKARRERQIFAQFAEVANESLNLGIDATSIKCEDEPKPDISCMMGAGKCYFELTEITDEGLARSVSISVKEMTITGGVFSQDSPLIDALTNKAIKTYPDLDGSLDLLAYYDKQYPPSAGAIQESTRRELYWIIQSMTRFGQWSRIWIYDTWNKRILGLLSYRI
jgi:hypothetical protein